MNRRGFLGSILALGAAPAIVRADSLMRIIPQEITLYVPNSAPLLLVPGESYVSWGLAGMHDGRAIAVSQMIRGVVNDSLRHFGRIHDLRFIEDSDYDLREDLTTIRARATYNREIPQYREEDCPWGVDTA